MMMVFGSIVEQRYDTGDNLNNIVVDYLLRSHNPYGLWTSMSNQVL